MLQATRYGHSAPAVLLCPPHPQYGGNRRDVRLATIADSLAASGIGALCMDYSAYTGGPGEIEDVVFILRWMKEKVEIPGLAGYSYGAVIAANAAVEFPPTGGLVLVAPPTKIDGLNLDLSSPCEKLIIYGAHDGLLQPDPDKIYRSASGQKELLKLDTDHFFAGYESALAGAITDFFRRMLRNRPGPAGRPRRVPETQ
jgi:alpha/beta superfamily hydrolase